MTFAYNQAISMRFVTTVPVFADLDHIWLYDNNNLFGST